MPLHNEDGLFPALEAVMKESGEPMDCHQLLEFESIRKLGYTANRVSDYLGNMWRKGQLLRLPAGGDTRARWLYQWKDSKVAKPTAQAVGQQVLASRPNLTITETGDTITIELPQFTLTIKSKK